MPSRRIFRPAFLITLVAVALAMAACHRDSSDVPLSCPPGANLMGAPPPKGQEVWCQKNVDGKPVKDGLFVAYGMGGYKMIQGYYRKGVQDGEWTTWYENGQRSAVDHYRDGLQNGLHTSWYANGVKALEGNYRAGKREGVWTRWDPTGFTNKQETYRDDLKITIIPRTK
ncbi:MAG: toxin-antitoxin system YwqK family antitoxin [Deltaproteobacteria bacterium]|nr:toxin-antitoxin system YwqK family antitoxin [Deltaproteobacteria bacterium]